MGVSDPTIVKGPHSASCLKNSKSSEHRCTFQFYHLYEKVIWNSFKHCTYYETIRSGDLKPKRALE